MDAERYTENPDGFHTWTEQEILQFEDHHGITSKPVLALRLILNTGAARQDVCRLGRQNVRDGRIAYRRGKTGGEVDLPILDELFDVLDAAADRSPVVSDAHGRSAVQANHVRQLVSRSMRCGRPAALLIAWPAQGGRDSPCRCRRKRARDHGVPRPSNARRGANLCQEIQPQAARRHRHGEGREGEKGTRFVQPGRKVGHSPPQGFERKG